MEPVAIGVAFADDGPLRLMSFSRLRQTWLHIRILCVVTVTNTVFHFNPLLLL